jgi:hypothetical protein
MNEISPRYHNQFCLMDRDASHTTLTSGMTCQMDWWRPFRITGPVSLCVCRPSIDFVMKWIVEHSNVPESRVGFLKWICMFLLKCGHLKGCAPSDATLSKKIPKPNDTVRPSWNALEPDQDPDSNRRWGIIITMACFWMNSIRLMRRLHRTRVGWLISWVIPSEQSLSSLSPLQFRRGNVRFYDYQKVLW